MIRGINRAERLRAHAISASSTELQANPKSSREAKFGHRQTTGINWQYVKGIDAGLECPQDAMLRRLKGGPEQRLVSFSSLHARVFAPPT
jgi:hypothetical protein